MPQFTVNLPDGGQIVVNASNAQAALGNVGSAANGAVVTSGAYTGQGSAMPAQPAPSSTAAQPAAQTGGTQAPTVASTSSALPTIAADGQSLAGQSSQTQADFRAVYGTNAAAAWAIEHNRAIGAPNPIPAAPTQPANPTAQTTAPGQAGVTKQDVDAAIAKLQAGLNQSAVNNLDLEKQRLQLEKDRLQLDRDRATTDMQLARNADARAEAQLRIQQADQQLRQLQFEESKLEFQKNIAEQQREFNQGQYTNLATSLLQGASNLRGPQDWLQYAQFTGGGRNLQQQLFGEQPNPAFGGERGESPVITVNKVLGDLGYLSQPGSAPQPVTPPTVPLPQQVNPAVWDQMSPQAQQLTLGLAQGGYTNNGVYTPEDYQRILNATRPFGQASRTTSSQYQAPVGVF